MVYIDANVFVHATLQPRGNALGDAGRKWLERTEKGEIEAATSVLTWDEVVWSVRKHAGRDAAMRASEEFLELPNLLILSTTRETAERAHHLVEVCGMKPRDAVHAASALLSGEAELLSDDPDFDSIPGLKRIRLG